MGSVVVAEAKALSSLRMYASMLPILQAPSTQPTAEPTYSPTPVPSASNITTASFHPKARSKLLYLHLPLAAGGVALVILTAGVIFYLRKRRRRPSHLPVLPKEGREPEEIHYAEIFKPGPRIFTVQNPMLRPAGSSRKGRRR